MNALANEVHTFCFALIVQVFEFCSPLEKNLVGGFELLPCDPALVERPDTNDKLTVVSIVGLRKYPIEQVLRTGSRRDPVSNENL